MSHWKEPPNFQARILILFWQFYKFDIIHSVHCSCTHFYIQTHTLQAIHKQNSSPNIIRVIKSRRLRWAGHVARKRERRGAYRALVGKPEGRRPLGRSRRRWEDNIKTDLWEVGWGGMDWINLASGSIKCGEFLEHLRTFSFSGRTLLHGVSE
jgi:hypothetical protein